MDMNSFLNKYLEKGYEWLSRLISTTDHSLTKVSQFLQSKKKILDDYMMDRQKLLTAIKDAQLEIDYLQNKINQSSSHFSDRLLELYEKLEFRTQELMDSHEQITTFFQKINRSWRFYESF